MNPIHHPLIRAWPLVGALLLPNYCVSAESGSSPAPDLAPGTAPARPMAATVPAGIPAESPHDRIISPRLAAILAVSLPKYDPTARPSEKNGTVDRPREENPDSEILHLPTYVVHAPRPPVFREREILTQRGLEKLAMKRYITQLDRVLNRYRIPLIGISCEARALAMYAEDERLRDMADLDRAARNAALVDRFTAAEIKRQAAATFQRTSE
jgi:hypothetical protein